jgi:hypothetical protein
LSSPDPSTNQNDALKKRHTGTGLWFVDGEKFAYWKTSPKSFIWLHGIPGCGKTVLSSAIIEDLGRDTSQVLLYFFFDFSAPEKQSLNKMLRSLITQLYRQRQETRKHLDMLWKSCEKGLWQPSVLSLTSTFTAMLDDAENVRLVLDALDESKTRDDLLEWLQTLSQTTSVRLIVTSRKVGDIEAALASFAQSEDIVSILRSDVNKDIGVYVRYRVQHDLALKRWNSRPEVQREIETALIEKADGM